MGKLLILFLSFFTFDASCFCQSQSSGFCNCSNKAVQDSLVKHYLDSGAEKFSYNGPEWQLYCDSLIALCPNIGEAYQHKAIPYIKNGDYARAFPLEDKAVDSDPREWTAYRAFLKCIFTKDYTHSILDFEKAERLTPGGYTMDHTYQFYEGLCNIELTNFAKAEKNLRQDMFIQTGDSSGNAVGLHYNTLLYTGILYYEMKNYALSERFLLKCLAIYAQLPDANYYLGLVYAKQNNIQLKDKYLELARRSKMDGFGLNEDNVYYAYYPHQVTLFEIDNAIKEPSTTTAH